MGFIYQEANAYGVEALVALERHYTPTEEKYCTAVTEAVRICDTYGIPERELVQQVVWEQVCLLLPMLKCN